MNDGLLESMDGMRDIVASMAGIKTLFIEAGFSQEISELMVLEILKKSTWEIMHFQPVYLEPGFLSNEEKDYLKEAVDERVHSDKKYFVDDMHRRELRRWKLLDDYAEKLTPLAIEIFGDPTLKPTYSVLLSYDRGSRLVEHRDTYACVYTIDYCVSSNIDWPLIIEGEKFNINPGEALAFMGGHDLHGRPKMPDVEDALVENIMFHFCPADHWWFTEGPEYAKGMLERGEVEKY